MEYKKNENGLVMVRFDDGDELISSLKWLCRKESITSALVSGIGACRKAEIAHYDTSKKAYNNKKVEGALEIIALSGNITIKEGEPMPHLHIALGNKDFSVIGGHVVSIEVNPTCEMTLLPLEIMINRGFDQKSGLWIQRF